MADASASSTRPSAWTISPAFPAISRRTSYQPFAFETHSSYAERSTLRGISGEDAMAADLSAVFTGIRFENPFLLASAPPTESDTNIMRAFEAGWGGVVTKTIGLHPVVNVAGAKTKFLRADTHSPRISMKVRPESILHSSWNWELISDKPL